MFSCYFDLKNSKFDVEFFYTQRICLQKAMFNHLIVRPFFIIQLFMQSVKNISLIIVGAPMLIKLVKHIKK